MGVGFGLKRLLVSTCRVRRSVHSSSARATRLAVGFQGVRAQHDLLDPAGVIRLEASCSGRCRLSRYCRAMCIRKLEPSTLCVDPRLANISASVVAKRMPVNLIESSIRRCGIVLGLGGITPFAAVQRTQVVWALPCRGSSRGRKAKCQRCQD